MSAQQSLIASVTTIANLHQWSAKERDALLLNILHDECDRFSAQLFMRDASAVTVRHLASYLLKHFAFTLAKKSVSKLHRGSFSYYLATNDDIIRLSDHELPRTHQRQHSENLGNAKYWTAQALLDDLEDDWKNMALADLADCYVAYLEDAYDITVRRKKND